MVHDFLEQEFSFSEARSVGIQRVHGVCKKIVTKLIFIIFAKFAIFVTLVIFIKFVRTVLFGALPSEIFSGFNGTSANFHSFCNFHSRWHGLNNPDGLLCDQGRLKSKSYWNETKMLEKWLNQCSWHICLMVLAYGLNPQYTLSVESQSQLERRLTSWLFWDYQEACT